ncbi:hypothetical protein BJ508DRAFT_327642 [Ascobolus immersus RN42]|uniref:Uncharacterized protein n=1 Tax=Ascobolus immersus RN42 TaxID=1160509 RepID=A0A3N4I7R0_ASCIM|nr:hypothetical protein BJ508DRAFT_327642 [Ascobolus immersus RN42]
MPKIKKEESPPPPWQPVRFEKGQKRRIKLEQEDSPNTNNIKVRVQSIAALQSPQPDKSEHQANNIPHWQAKKTSTTPVKVKQEPGITHQPKNEPTTTVRIKQESPALYPRTERKIKQETLPPQPKPKPTTTNSLNTRRDKARRMKAQRKVRKQAGRALREVAREVEKAKAFTNAVREKVWELREMEDGWQMNLSGGVHVGWGEGELSVKRE